MKRQKYADIIVHIIDLISTELLEQRNHKQLYTTLKQLGVEGKPVVTLFNNVVFTPEKPAAKDLHADYTYNHIQECQCKHLKSVYRKLFLRAE